MIYEIGDKIKFNRNANSNVVESEVTGRNWFGDRLISYIVRIDHMDITVNAESMKSEFSWY